MRKIYGTVLFLFLVFTAAAQSLELKTGLGLEFYGFHAEDSLTSLDSHYTSIGLDLGGSLEISEGWDLTGGLFIGIPFRAAVFMDGELFSEPDLSMYNYYSYYINLKIGGVRRFEWDGFSLSLGPVLSFHDLVLASYEKEPGYVLSYTSGLGAICRFEYSLKGMILYADLNGSWNFLEMLVIHDDFSYAYEAGLSLGLVWRI